MIKCQHCKEYRLPSMNTTNQIRTKSSIGRDVSRLYYGYGARWWISELYLIPIFTLYQYLWCYSFDPILTNVVLSIGELASRKYPCLCLWVSVMSASLFPLTLRSLRAWGHAASSCAAYLTRINSEAKPQVYLAETSLYYLYKCKTLWINWGKNGVENPVN